MGEATGVQHLTVNLPDEWSRNSFTDDSNPVFRLDLDRILNQRAG